MSTKCYCVIDYIQGLVCLRCCWSISICEMTRLFASIVPLWLGNLDECTFVLAFQDRLCQLQSNDWKIKKTQNIRNDIPSRNDIAIINNISNVSCLQFKLVACYNNCILICLVYILFFKEHIYVYICAL